MGHHSSISSMVTRFLAETPVQQDNSDANSPRDVLIGQSLRKHLESIAHDEKTQSCADADCGSVLMIPASTNDGESNGSFTSSRNMICQEEGDFSTGYDEPEPYDSDPGLWLRCQGGTTY